MELLRGKKVLVMGLGINNGGLGVCQWLVKHHIDVRVTDLRSATILKPSLRKLAKSKIKFILGRHEYEDFDWADIIIQNPAVPESSPYIQYARKKHKKIVNEAVLFFWLCPAPIIGITGSRGKSTTASFLYQLLKNGEKKVYLTGNIAQNSFMQIVDSIKKDDLVVAELSSWHLERLAEYSLSPHYAVLTSIFPEHLNRYASYAEYRRAKEAITKYQTKNDFFFTIKDNAYCRAIAQRTKAKVTLISYEPRYAKLLKLPGRHNVMNLTLAVAVARKIGLTQKTIEELIPRLQGLPLRLQDISKKKGLAIINDSASTSPDALIIALQAMKSSKLLTITGGVNKDLDYKHAVKELVARSAVIMMLPGTASDNMLNYLERMKKKPPVIKINSLAEALIKTRPLIKKKLIDTILFSPGGASFNLFLNEFDRGEKFNATFKKL